MRVVRAVPTESIPEKLSVQRLTEALGVRDLRVNVFTPAEGSMSKHLHREQEEVDLVHDGTAMIDVDKEKFKVGEREGPGSAAARLAPGGQRGVRAADLLRGGRAGGGRRRRDRRLRR